MIDWFSDPTKEFMRLPEKLRDRIVRQMPIRTACWFWVGPRSYHGQPVEDGYGRQSWEGRNWLVHRLTYELLVGPIPKGLVLDHVKKRCQHRFCCRPDHMEPVTDEVNMMRGDGYLFFGGHCEQTEEVPF